jgi:anti-sigma B factor antagonist
MSAAPKRIEVIEVGNATIVRFVDRDLIDQGVIQDAGFELFQLVEGQRGRRLLLDLGNLDYAASMALGKLIVFNKKATAAGGKLVLCNLTGTLREAFTLSKLDQLFDIREWDANADPGADLGGAWSGLPPRTPADGVGAAVQPPP